MNLKSIAGALLHPSRFYYKYLQIKVFYVEKKLILRAIKEKPEYVLINTPLHGNLGDHAISIAERGIIGNHKCIEIAANFVQNIKLYKDIVEQSSVRKIIITGGGNLGSLWLIEELNFRSILQNFPQKDIIVFPQTIYFDMKSSMDMSFYEESKKIYSSHKKLIVFVREEKTYNFMLSYFPEVSCRLVPDAVLFLNNSPIKYNRKGIIFCLRKDKEKSADSDFINEIKIVIKNIYPSENISFIDTVLPVNVSVGQINRKIQVDKIRYKFSKSKLIFTDRLHGMIFAAITATPCIAVNNSSGKVKAVYKWISYLPYVKFIENIDEFKYTINSLDLKKSYSYTNTQLQSYFENIRKSLYE